MADINSTKNAIIIQPITLQIRAPFQFLTNQWAIKHTHYSESRDGLNGRCSFSAECMASEYSWTVSSTYHKGCKVEQISPLFHLYLYLFFKFRRAPVLFYANLACQVLYRYLSTQSTAVGLWLSLSLRRRSWPFVAFKFIYFKYIYTREKLLLAKSTKQSKGKGVSRSQLQCQATTALRILSTSIEPESSKSTSLNIREGNFDDEVRVTWILVRTSTEPQRSQNEDQREH